jgi:hypothetical protein
MNENQLFMEYNFFLCIRYNHQALEIHKKSINYIILENVISGKQMKEKNSIDSWKTRMED